MDPLKTPYEPEIALELAINLNGKLNTFFQSNVRIIDNPHANISRQKNGYDCGPFVCAYSLFVSYISKRIIRIDPKFISRIRYEVYLLQCGKVNHISQLGGSGNMNNNANYSKLNFKINESIFNKFSNQYIASNSVMFIDNILTTAILDECTDYLKNFLNLDKLIQSTTIFVMFRPPKAHRLLLVLDFTQSVVLVLNPTTSICNDRFISLGQTITNSILELRGLKESFVVVQHKEYETRGSGLFSNILLCGYMLNYIKIATSEYQF